MECSNTVRRWLPKSYLLLAVMLTGTDALADRAVVLVTGIDSQIEALSSLEIRKAYLGYTVANGDQSLHPLRIGGEYQLNQIFLQAAVGMSEKSYERRLLFMVLKYGEPRPPVYADMNAILDALQANPFAITYMWKSDAEKNPGVRIIKVLWQE